MPAHTNLKTGRTYIDGLFAVATVNAANDVLLRFFDCDDDAQHYRSLCYHSDARRIMSYRVKKQTTIETVVGGLAGYTATESPVRIGWGWEAL